ncbi:MBL fold metallo-hydrolase [Luteimonas sp. R10]|uniref:MBL fold metallo-hydrolase n=1 Tax=Luteimonas sp. R10 TaxID=3108176 RepID=UPI00309298CE|nr:MBL fold metallo-hydrolase [Luteimonas sp. R10]
MTQIALQLIRSATLKLRLGARTLLIDPYLAAQHEGVSYGGRLRSPLAPLPLPVTEILAGVDAAFVSHLHSDHFDEAARRLLPPDMPILCAAALADDIRASGFRHVTAIETDTQWSGTGFELTGGRHGPDSVLAEMGEVHGFVASMADAPTLYWVGDSIWCPEVRTVVDRRRPAHVVVHACGATWRGSGSLVMDEHHVEALLRHAPWATVTATHLDCVDHATTSRARLARHFRSMPTLRRRLWIPADGETLALD